MTVPATIPKPPKPAPSEDLRLHLESLAEELVSMQLLALPELNARYGSVGREKCLQDARHHLACLADALNAGDSALFASYIAWAKIELGNRGIPAEDLAIQLDLTRTLISGRLDGQLSVTAVEYINAALAGLPSFPGDLPSYLPPDSPHVLLANQYLESLLKGDRSTASRLILDAVQTGVTVKEIYLHVFQPTQYEVGRLWQINRISVAQEHYCTAATQLIMSQLYPQIFATQKGGGTMVATCVEGDLHEIGVRMVADFFELDGWHTFYLGASAPAQLVIDTVIQRRAQILGISATISSHLDAVGELIRKIRANPACWAVKILVGGHPFLVSPELWRKLGADGCARDAQEAITLANSLISEEGGK